ncbi:siroheme synthase CysG [Planctobacterium marinum]|uniref:siroheme synthase CysG n=1 Tax=Planctobacterium marinum TaxID=1631968 RepID=UPI001E36B8FB|nr:siroheme synthase CysG [Planctobacterium marinum]MCC2604912.1 siroheme synthase CysG [Planctobacterium marinum]
MRYFPLFFDTQNIQVLVVGAGEVAARKIELLLKTEATISVVAPDVSPTVALLAQQGKITLHQNRFEVQYLDGAQLVFIATNDETLNAGIQQQAKARNIIVNVVDNPPLCDFITPSIVDRGNITIAMSSGGVAPVLLRYLRQKLEAIIPQNIRYLGDFAEKFRETVKSKLPTVTQRRYFWEWFFDSDVAEGVLQGNLSEAEMPFLEKLESAGQDESFSQGQVYLIGAGPGDPELLTFRALRLMQKADVVIFDRLVSPQIMDLVRRDAEKIYVGKEKSNHTIPQEQISAMLVEKAKEGHRVVRLKGGDPFIFGRGGEELETLVDAGVDFQVVPGITAANGAASYAGIPLTHRDHAQSVVFATGHLKDNTINLNWSGLAQPNQTIVFYMGLTGLSVITEKLQEHGLSGDTPIALVQQATLESQKVVTGTLANILDNPDVATLKPPTLIIVGTVVSLQQQFDWFNPATIAEKSL